MNVRAEGSSEEEPVGDARSVLTDLLGGRGQERKVGLVSQRGYTLMWGFVTDNAPVISSRPPCPGHAPKWLVAVTEVESDRDTIPTPVGMKDPTPHPRPVISSPREAEPQGASIPENLTVSSRTTENPAIKPQCWDGTMVLLNLVASPTLGWLGPQFPSIHLPL